MCQVDAAAGFSELLASKDAAAITKAKKAAFLAASAMKNFAVPELESARPPADSAVEKTPPVLARMCAAGLLQHRLAAIRVGISSGQQLWSKTFVAQLAREDMLAPSTVSVPVRAVLALHDFKCA